MRLAGARRFIVVCAAVGAFACMYAGCGAGQGTTGGFHPGVHPTGAPLLTLPTALGTWEVSLWTSPQPPRKGAVDVKYRIVDRAASVTDALTFDVVPWMPAHGHGTSTPPTVTSEGDGWYLVTPVVLYMAGRWELRTTITGPVSDSVVPVLDVP